MSSLENVRCSVPYTECVGNDTVRTFADNKLLYQIENLRDIINKDNSRQKAGSRLCKHR